MSTLKIEKGIPISRPKGGARISELGMALRSLSVSDSVFVEEKTTRDVIGVVQASSLATQYKFVTRLVDGGVRIWRVS